MWLQPTSMVSKHPTQLSAIPEEGTNDLLRSLKLTWPLKIGHPKRKLVFQPSIFRCYVSFRKGSWWFQLSTHLRKVL